MKKGKGQAGCDMWATQIGQGTFRVKEGQQKIAWAYRQNENPGTPIYWVHSGGFNKLQQGQERAWVFDSNGTPNCAGPADFLRWVVCTENGGTSTGLTRQISLEGTWDVPPPSCQRARRRRRSRR